jgi:hypothetical protein
LKQLYTLPGLVIDTVAAEQGKITLYKNIGNGILNLPDIRDIVEFEFKPLVHKTGKYSIWIDQTSWMKTNESAGYAVLLTNANIDLRSSRKLKGNIVDLKGRPFSNAIVQVKSDDDLSTVTPVSGSYDFDMIDNIAYDVHVIGKGPDYSNPDLLDLIQLSRYTNGLEQIPSGQILYSSDLDDDGQVNDADLVQLKSLILSKQDKFPGKTIFSLHTGSDNAARLALQQMKTQEPYHSLLM